MREQGLDRNHASKMDGQSALFEAKQTSSSVEAATAEWAEFAGCPVRADKMKIGRCFSRRLAMVILAIAGLVGWLGRESLLREAADLWVVSDPLTHADAIVVLGGNYQTRAPAAADLYRRGLANKVLVSHGSDCESNRAALLKLGVPASAVETFGKTQKSTREEAIALREWAEQSAASAFL